MPTPLVGALLHRALLEHEPMTARWLEKLVDLAVEGVRPRPVIAREASHR
jgi:hypothetical protein